MGRMSHPLIEDFLNFTSRGFFYSNTQAQSMLIYALSSNTVKPVPQSYKSKMCNIIDIPMIHGVLQRLLIEQFTIVKKRHK